ncbi:MAG: DUF3137 domain-containing protein [Oscillospiraceae bacterium]|nr:DUF3137 domain-containing protein [Oscillospiraceae bacterium]
MHVPTRIKIRSRSGDFAEGKKAESNVITPNTGFNLRFHVVADNPNLAAYILTPEFMQRVIKIDNGRLRMCLEPGRAHVAYNTSSNPVDFTGKDSGHYTFEVTGEEWEMADLDKLRDRFRQEIRHLTDVIDIICDGDGLSRS